MEASPEKKILSGTLGPKLRQERQRHHLSQEKLAEMVGCDVRSIRRWEQGKGIPDYENRHRLSKALDITLEHFHQLLQPVEEKDDKPLESEAFNIALEDFHQFLPSVKERNVKLPESDIQVPETLPDSNHSISVGSEVQAKHLVQHQQRRALLKWGGIGLATTLAGGGGLFYWFSRSTSSTSSIPLSLSPLSSSLSPQSPHYHIHTFNALSGAGIREVEWSPHHDAIICVDKNNRAYIITVSSDANSSSQSGLDNANSSSQTIADNLYYFSPAIPSVGCVTWSPDGTQLASSNVHDNLVHLWSPQNNADTPFPYTFGKLTSIAWSYNGKIAVCGANGLVGTWNAVKGGIIQMYPGHIGTVWRVAWSPDGTYLATAGADGTVRIWDTTKKDQFPLTIYKGHHSAVFDVKWSRFAHPTIVSASQDTTVQIWNPITGKTKLVYRQHKASVKAAEWSAGGDFIASAGDDATIRVWDALEGNDYEIYREHKSTIWALSWSIPYGMDLASASEDGTMRIRSVNISS